MARILSQTLIRESQTLIRDPPPSHLFAAARSRLLRPSSHLISFRGRSHRSDKAAAAQLVEIDLEGEASSGAGEVEVLGMRRLEDAIHGIMVRRSAPDWLPFIPGSSYWVPPRRKRTLGLIELVRKFVNPMSEEESLSLTTARGWPSLSYFVEGALPHPVKTSSEKTTAQPEEEE